MKMENNSLVQNTEMELSLVSNPANVMRLVLDGQAALVPTQQLNVFYTQADAIEKHVGKLKEKSRATIIARRDEGALEGAEGQHRVFTYDTPQGHVELKVQTRQKWNPDPDKLEKLLRRKKLWSRVVDLKVPDPSASIFQSFLHEHRAQLRTLGLILAEEVNKDKVDGLCQAKLITTEEMQDVIQQEDPTYALIAKLR